MKELKEVEEELCELRKYKYIDELSYLQELANYIDNNYLLIPKEKPKAVGLLLPVEDTVTRLIERNEYTNKKIK